MRNKTATTKLTNWIDGQSDYEMTIETDFSDWGDGGEYIMIWKKRVHPKPKNLRFVRNCMIDTHYYVIRVYPKRKLYNIGDNRMFSKYKTIGLTFNELIESITDESCGYDYTLIVGNGKVDSSFEIFTDGTKPKWIFYQNGKALTNENMIGTVL